MTVLFVAWQDDESRRWLPVGRLSQENDDYVFVYTKGALESERFRAFGQMTELGKKYYSDRLFPLFANRLMSNSRPEFDRYMEWIGMSSEDASSDIEILSRSEGMRASEGIRLFPRPEMTIDRLFEMTFFSHGIRYLEQWENESILVLEPGAELRLVLDDDNPVDSEALLVCLVNNDTRVGWVPRYIAPDLRSLISGDQEKKLRVVAKRVNNDAPSQMRLLCRLTAPWPDGFEPFAGRLFQPVDREAQLSREQKIA